MMEDIWGVYFYTMGIVNGFILGLIMRSNKWW